MGKVHLAHDYLSALSHILGGTVKQTPHPDQWCVVKGGTPPLAIELLRGKDNWLKAIEDYQAGFSEPEED
jgi:hypothetical protein